MPLSSIYTTKFFMAILWYHTETFVCLGGCGRSWCCRDNNGFHVIPLLPDSQSWFFNTKILVPLPVSKQEVPRCKNGCFCFLLVECSSNFNEIFICWLVAFMVFNDTFNNISVISWQSVLLVEETGGPGENHWPVGNHWQTLSHNVVYLSLMSKCAKMHVFVIYTWRVYLSSDFDCFFNEFLRQIPFRTRWTVS